MIDLTGCQRLHGDEVVLMQRIRTGLARLGIHARLAVADTIGAAWATARFGGKAATSTGRHGTPVIEGEPGVRRIAPGRTAEAIASMPVAALRITCAAVDELAQVGIETIDQLRRVPRRELAGRGGGWRDGGLLARLDQALGRRPERIDPIVPPMRPSVARVFDGPVVQPEAIVLAVRELLGDLVRQLESLECGVTRLDLRFDCPDVEPQRFHCSLGVPTRSMHHLWSMLTPRLERVHLDFGVEGIDMQATRIARLHQRQTDWTGETGVGARSPLVGTGSGGGGAASAVPVELDAATRRRQEHALGQLVDTLVDRLGPDRVLRRQAVDTHVPEQSMETRPAAESRLVDLLAPPATVGAVPERDAEETAPGWGPIVENAEGIRPEDARDPSQPTPGHRRPSRLLPVPEPAEVTTGPSGLPRRVRWRSNDHQIVRSIGPERITAPWWESRRERDGARGADPDRGQIVREYHRVQDGHGRWLWIFRREDPSVDIAAAPVWFVHGLWA